MSSKPVRDELLEQIRLLAGETQVFDLTDYVSIEDLPENEHCIAVEFVVSTEEIATIGDPETLGFEEVGTVRIHWLRQTGFGSADALTNAGALYRGLRGRRFGALIIESISPFSGSRSTADRHSKWTGLASHLFYSEQSFQ